MKLFSLALKKCEVPDKKTIKWLEDINFLVIKEVLKVGFIV